jgi:hypothetical protein
MDNGLDSKASKISSGTHELSLRLRLLRLSSGQTAERPEPDVHIAQGCKCRPTLIVLCALSEYSVDPADVWMFGETEIRHVRVVSSILR